MKRYISLCSLAALLGFSLAAGNDTSSFLNDKEAQFLRDSAKAACYIYKDLTYFDLTPLQNRNDSGYPVDNVTSLNVVSSNYGVAPQLHFNLCAYTQDKCRGNNTFAYITSTTLNEPLCLTDNDIFDTNPEILLTDQGKKYIQFTQDGGV